MARVNPRPVPLGLLRRIPPAALGLLLACASTSNDEGPLNVLIVTIDTIRADHVGCYGYFRNTTPAIDSLAAESILFERCTVPMATTLPSHLSLLTGLYPVEHGVTGNIGQGGRAFRPASGALSYAQLARRAGYRTAAFVSAAPLDSATGVSRGFDLYDEPAERERDAAATTRRVLRWIDGSMEEPFLLWVHYFDPHAPYLPPPPFDETFLPDEHLRLFLLRRGVEPKQRVQDFTVDCDETITRYDGEIRYADDQLSILLRHLRVAGLWDRTVVLLAGDHGEGLGQHGKWTHGQTWREELHAPLMIRVPGGEPRHVTAVVSLADALPMMLGLCPSLPREDYLERATGVDRLAPGEHGAVFSQQSPRRTREERFDAYSLTGDRWKYISHTDGKEFLFDLQADPHELVDQSARFPDVAAAMKNDVIEKLYTLQENALDLRRGMREEEEEVMIDSSRLEQLRALGYLD